MRRRTLPVQPGEVQLIAPPPTIRFFRKLRIRLAAGRDRRRRTDADAERHTAFSRWLLHEALVADTQARLWARDRIRPLAAEAAALEGRTAVVPTMTDAPAPVRPATDAGLAAGALWAQDVRSVHAARAEHQRATAARSADQERLVRLRSQIEAIDAHATEVRAQWRELHQQEVAMYTHARTRRRTAQTSPLPAYPGLPAYPAARRPDDGPGEVLERALRRASNHAAASPGAPVHQP